MAGTVGAIFNGALQLGSAIGIAAVDSVETSVQEQQGASGYAGQRAAFWFLLGIVGVEWIALAVFYRTSKEVREDEVLEKAEVLDKIDNMEKMNCLEELGKEDVIRETQHADAVGTAEDEIKEDWRAVDSPV